MSKKQLKASRKRCLQFAFKQSRFESLRGERNLTE